MVRGGTASGRPNRRGGTPTNCKVPESGSKKRVPLFFTFGRFWRILVDLTVDQWVQVNRTLLPIGDLRGHADVVFCIVCGCLNVQQPLDCLLSHQLEAVFVFTTIFEVHEIPLASTKILQYSPKVPKIGVHPFFDPLSGTLQCWDTPR